MKDGILNIILRAKRKGAIIISELLLYTIIAVTLSVAGYKAYQTVSSKIICQIFKEEVQYVALDANDIISASIIDRIDHSDYKIFINKKYGNYLGRFNNIVKSSEFKEFNRYNVILSNNK